MRRLVFAIVLGTATLAPVPGVVVQAPDRAQPRVLRCVTFNLLHGGISSELTGADEALEARLRIVAEELRALGADVIGLQEASTGAQRGHVAARLAAALGYHYVHAPAATRPFKSESMRRAVASVLRFTEGPALVSRFPIAAWRAYELPHCGRPLDVRVLLFAEILTPGGRLPTFSAHISGDPCQARAVADLVRANRGAVPSVVLGDFNAVESSPAIRLLTRHAGFLDTYRLANPTAPGFTQGQDLNVSGATADRRIDYVFLVPGLEAAGRVVSSRVVLNQPRRGNGRGLFWPSDHYGVLADIALDHTASVDRSGTRRHSFPEGA